MGRALIVSKNIGVAKAILRIFTILVGRLVGKISDAVIVNDGVIKEGMIRHGIKKSKIFILRGATHTDIFKPLKVKRHSTTELNVGFIGRLTDEKGTPLLLNLCKTAMVKLPQVKFIIFGDGPYKEEFRVLPNVKHVGEVAHSMLCRWLSVVDVVLSFQKSFGMGEIEALSCGRPIIASKIGEMPQLIKDQETGLLCQPEVDSFLKAISTLMNNRVLLKRLSENARCEAIKRYDWKIRREQWKLILNSILEDRKEPELFSVLI